MIGQFIALYKARKDPELAKRIASEMIVDGVIERASWPITIAKLWLSLAIIAITAAIFILLAIGTATHWSLTIPILPLGGAIYGIIKLWRGVNTGMERVSSLAKAELGKRVGALNEAEFQNS